MKTQQHLMALILAVIGFGFGCLTAFLAGGLTGAGHGWGSGSWCILGVVTLPLFGAGVAYRGTKPGTILLWVVAVAMIVIDLIILAASQQEGWDYLQLVMARLPFVFAIWMICWTAWQVAVIYLLVKTHLRQD